MNLNLEAELRKKGKRSDLNELRKAGFIPGIIYGEGKEGIPISIPKISFLKLYKKTIGEMVFYDISVDNKKIKTVIREKQIHPVSREILHIDFLELHKGKEVTLEVPIKIIGDAPGTHEGGLLEVLVRKIEISCLPKDVPEEIEVDVSNLNIGDVIHFSQIKSEDMQTKLQGDTTIVAVRAPRKIEEVEKAEEIEEEAIEAEEAAEEKTEETTD